MAERLFCGSYGDWQRFAIATGTWREAQGALVEIEGFAVAALVIAEFALEQR
ncbi:MAG: hypothetical protein ACRD37_09715 [Candidatus Acidiferrales bacterium]